MSNQAHITSAARDEGHKQIVLDTLNEFRGDFDKQIIDTPTAGGDLDGAAVFEALARIEDKSLRALGNDARWKMTGREAALSIAESRVWDSMLDTDAEAEFSEAQALVREVVKGGAR